MMMPPQQTAKVIITQPKFLFAILETRFNGPAHAGDPDQGGQRCIGRGIRQVIFGSERKGVAETDCPQVGAGQDSANGDDPDSDKVGD